MGMRFQGSGNRSRRRRRERKESQCKAAHGFGLYHDDQVHNPRRPHGMSFGTVHVGRSIYALVPYLLVKDYAASRPGCTGRTV